MAPPLQGGGHPDGGDGFSLAAFGFLGYAVDQPFVGDGLFFANNFEDKISGWLLLFLFCLLRRLRSAL